MSLDSEEGSPQPPLSLLPASTLHTDPLSWAWLMDGKFPPPLQDSPSRSWASGPQGVRWPWEDFLPR